MRIHYFQRISCRLHCQKLQQILLLALKIVEEHHLQQSRVTEILLKMPACPPPLLQLIHDVQHQSSNLKQILESAHIHRQLEILGAYHFRDMLIQHLAIIP